MDGTDLHLVRALQRARNAFDDGASDLHKAIWDAHAAGMSHERIAQIALLPLVHVVDAIAAQNQVLADLQFGDYHAVAIDSSTGLRKSRPRRRVEHRSW